MGAHYNTEAIPAWLNTLKTKVLYFITSDEIIDINVGGNSDRLSVQCDYFE